MTGADDRLRHIQARFAVLAVIVAMIGQLFPEQRAASADREVILMRNARPVDRVTVSLPSGWRPLRVSEPVDVSTVIRRVERGSRFCWRVRVHPPRRRWTPMSAPTG